MANFLNAICGYLSAATSDIADAAATSGDMVLSCSKIPIDNVQQDVVVGLEQTTSDVNLQKLREKEDAVETESDEVVTASDGSPKHADDSTQSPDFQ